jgi:hypothetical protein
VAILESLYQHRLLTTRHVRALHAWDVGARFTRQILARLRDAGLAARTGLPGGLGAWYLTEQGVAALETIPNRVETRRKLVTPEQAGGPLQAHTLAVNDVGVAFAAAARERPGDDCGPYAWRHEIAHPLPPRPGRRRPEQLITDAVLTYQLTTGPRTSFHYRFIELDRANRSADDLACRLARYARLYRHTVTDAQGGNKRVALWTQLYAAFPGLLVALAGRDRAALERRRQTVLAICRAHDELASTPQVEIAICLHDELVADGPFAPIFLMPARRDEPVNWLGQPEDGGRA